MNAWIEAPHRPATPAAGSVPIVYAVPTKGGSLLKFWCPFCERFHLHGRPTGDMVRHRVAHCAGNDASPFADTGYVLVEVAPHDPRLTPPPRGRRPTRHSGRS